MWCRCGGRNAVGKVMTLRLARNCQPGVLCGVGREVVVSVCVWCKCWCVSGVEVGWT